MDWEQISQNTFSRAESEGPVTVIAVVSDLGCQVRIDMPTTPAAAKRAAAKMLKAGLQVFLEELSVELTDKAHAAQ